MFTKTFTQHISGTCLLGLLESFPILIFLDVFIYLVSRGLWSECMSVHHMC